MDQSKDGGYWVQNGTYEMKAGDYSAVRISPGDGSGAAVADAVTLVKGVASPPPNDLAPADGGKVSAGVDLSISDAPFSASRLNGRVKGRRRIQRGRWHIGTRYRLSPPAPCWAYVKEDCSCFTKIVLRRFKWLPNSPVLQYQYGHKVRSRSNLKRGDLEVLQGARPRTPHNPRGHIQRQRAHPSRLRLLQQGRQLEVEVHQELLRRQADTPAPVAAGPGFAQRVSVHSVTRIVHLGEARHRDRLLGRIRLLQK